MFIEVSKEFDIHIKKAALKKIYFLTGDGYFVNYNCNRLVERVTDRNAGFNYYYFEGDGLDFQTFFDACETLPISPGCERNCVVVKDLPFDKMKADVLEQWLNYLKDIPDTSVAVFLSLSANVNVRDKQSKWKAIGDFFKANGCLADFSQKNSVIVLETARVWGKANGIVFERGALEYFVSCVGDDGYTMITEIEKLASYAGGRPVSNKMIDDICVKTVDAKANDLTLMLANGRRDEAFRNLDFLMDSGVEALFLNGCLIAEVMRIYQLRLRPRRMTIEQFANNMGQLEYPYEKLADVASKLSREKVRQLLDAVLRADRALKSFSWDEKNILQQLMAEMCEIYKGV